MANKSNSILSKLLVAMKKLSIEVNDQEICKKLELLISTTKEEINPNTIKSLFDDPLNFDSHDIPEPFSQYVRHFVYMIRRNNKLGVNLYDAPVIATIPGKKRVSEVKAPQKTAAKKKKTS